MNILASDIVQMIVHAGTMVKFVLLLLFFLSLFSWTIIFMKLRLFKRLTDENEKFMELFSSSREIQKVYVESKVFAFSPLAKSFRAGYAEFNRSKMLQANPGEDKIYHSHHTIMENIERVVKKILATQTSRLEKGLTFLATTGNASPFIGLFGTVWGIMTSFRSIGMKGSATLAVVAPGIAEALIATAAGLAAAIPAVVAFNYFTRRVRSFQVEMGNFNADLVGLLERGLMRMALIERKRGE
ncbi:MAG: protein TolQ [Deltaproteobacteria bacterium]|nr:protein TolQ [Deltaproteobacteria bacterium]MBW2076741.1 protein TolQ [Deltaproteobacteria bacterium]